MIEQHPVHPDLAALGWTRKAVVPTSKRKPRRQTTKCEVPTCPTCKQTTQATYDLNRDLVEMLAWGRDEFERQKDFHHWPSGPRWVAVQKRHATLRHFGLLEQCPARGDGWWRVTWLAEDFLDGHAMVKGTCRVDKLTKELVDLEGDDVSVEDVMGGPLDVVRLREEWKIREEWRREA